MPVDRSEMNGIREQHVERVIVAFLNSSHADVIAVPIITCHLPATEHRSIFIFKHRGTLVIFHTHIQRIIHQ